MCLKQLWFTWKLSLDVVFWVWLVWLLLLFFAQTSPNLQDQNIFLGPGIIQPSWSVFKNLSQVCDSSSLFETKRLSNKNSADSPCQPVKGRNCLLFISENPNIPQESPNPQNGRNSFITFWLRVWGMCQGYVGKLFDFTINSFDALFCIGHNVMWGFPKMVGFPNKPMGFPTKNDHFGCFWGTTISGNTHVS